MPFCCDNAAPGFQICFIVFAAPFSAGGERCRRAQAMLLIRCPGAMHSAADTVTSMSLHAPAIFAAAVSSFSSPILLIAPLLAFIAPPGVKSIYSVAADIIFAIPVHVSLIFSFRRFRCANVAQ